MVFLCCFQAQGSFTIVGKWATVHCFFFLIAAVRQSGHHARAAVELSPQPRQEAAAWAWAWRWWHPSGEPSGEAAGRGTRRMGAEESSRGIEPRPL